MRDGVFSINIILKLTDFWRTLLAKKQFHFSVMGGLVFDRILGGVKDAKHSVTQLCKVRAYFIYSLQQGIQQQTRHHALCDQGRCLSIVYI